jgi:hypothetical protein
MSASGPSNHSVRRAHAARRNRRRAASTWFSALSSQRLSPSSSVASPLSLPRIWQSAAIKIFHTSALSDHRSSPAYWAWPPRRPSC